MKMRSKWYILIILSIIIIGSTSCLNETNSPRLGFKNTAIPNLTIIKNDSLKTYEKGVLVNNLRQGHWPSFRENGKIISDAIFINDTLNGKFIMYSDNGGIAYEGYFLRGKPYGKWIFYHENGQIQSEGERQDDKLIGTWNFFNEDGSLKEKVVYK